MSDWLPVCCDPPCGRCLPWPLPWDFDLPFEPALDLLLAGLLLVAVGVVFRGKRLVNLALGGVRLSDHVVLA